MTYRQSKISNRTRSGQAGRISERMLLVLGGFFLFIVGSVSGGPAETTHELDGVEAVVFAVRQLKGPHWYENIGYAITGVDDKV